LRRLSIMYHGLSQAYLELNNIEQATHYARRAMTISETLNDRLSLARTENNLGLMLLQSGDRLNARHHLESAIRRFSEAGVEAGLAIILTSLCELELAESNFDEARRFGQEALELSARLSEETTVSDSHVWLGMVAEARGEETTADSEFALAFEGLEKLGSPPQRSSRAHAFYADILEARGDVKGAVTHLKRALASSGQLVTESRAAIA
jgi:tetratricopeptide (TPR) repeat protein